MHRNKKIIYTAHCVLNQNSVIRDWERAAGAFNDIVRVLLDNNIAIIQLPCPEFTFLGEDRPPKTKEEYDIPEFRNVCKELAEKVVVQMKEYKNNGYQIIGIVGIHGSPSCDILGDRGVFKEELLALMEKENIILNCFDILDSYIEGETNNLVDSFRTYINTSLLENI